MQRPILKKRPIPDFFDLVKSKSCSVTCSIGQWDALLDAAYKNGWWILELDDNENPHAAYKDGEV